MYDKTPILYFISGLGADKRIFEHLDLPGFTRKHLAWQLPLEDETIENYAKRLSEKIEDDNFLLIGLSFGGMMSMEIAKQRAVPGIILLSSIATKASMPSIFPKLVNSKLSKWIPDSWLKNYNFAMDYVFGTTTEENKQLVTEMLDQTDITYLRWAINVIGNWQNTEIAAPLVHIHGDADKVFPIGKTNADIIIPGGEHLMVLDKAVETSKAILDAIERLKSE